MSEIDKKLHNILFRFAKEVNYILLGAAYGIDRGGVEKLERIEKKTIAGIKKIFTNKKGDTCQEQKQDRTNG